MNKKDFKKFIKNLPLNINVMGRDRYFNSAVLVPLIKIEKEYYLLFQKGQLTLGKVVISVSLVVVMKIVINLLSIQP